jgi:hypothetical protein
VQFAIVLLVMVIVAIELILHKCDLKAIRGCPFAWAEAVLFVILLLGAIMAVHPH